MTSDELIKDFVDDHYKHFGYYPMEVEVEDRVYNWHEYWSMLEGDELEQDAWSGGFADNH